MRHQTTGSITLDTDAIAEAVIQGIRPLLDLNEALSPGDMADVLRDHLGGEPIVTDRLTTDLIAAGYRLVLTKKTPEQKADDWFRTDV